MAKRTFKKAKRTSWQQYVSTLNTRTPAKFVWDRLNRIRGNYHAFSLPLIIVNGTPCATLYEQANILCEHFQHVSSSSHYSPAFLQIKAVAEKKKIV
ncbi:hypothetical protein, partial [Bradyrhizobium sp. 33ap4]|uniref:hypothetical protein n=1 Tax=Bradyrhizobium sp. 33ap4 TaxID=3061630 RepID=UPI00292E1AAA